MQWNKEEKKLDDEKYPVIVEYSVVFASWEHLLH